jgi:sugar transferase EpsL
MPAQCTFMFKRLFDFFFSLIIICILSPLLVFVALLILILMGKPVLFKQERPGLHGKSFYLYKFRTMTDKRDVHGNLLPDDLRLTPLGRLLRRFSIDELPQLFNVLEGHLSLVGPRPLLMEYLPLYSPEQFRRHEVKPGITGWAQVNGRNALSWEEKFKLDVWYVDNWSIWLDMKILWLTAIKVFNRESINYPGEATMTKFTGYN